MLLSLNAFLLRPSTPPDVALADATEHVHRLLFWDGQRTADLAAIDEDVIGVAVPGDIITALVSRPRSPAPWIEFIRSQLALRDFGGVGTSYGAMLFCAVQDPDDASTRWIAWSFGTASKLLRRSANDPRFGLTIALNLLAASEEKPPVEASPPRQRGAQVREMRYRTTAPFFQQTGHRAARDIPVEGFRIDRSSDLLAAIGGRTESSTFTRTVVGGRSLRFRKDVLSLGELSVLSERLLALSRERTYQDAFSWVDNIQLVEEPAVLDVLRHQLIHDLLMEPIPPTVDAILPDDLLEIDDDRSIRYVLFPRERVNNLSRITLTVAMLAQWVRRLGGPERSAEALDADLRFYDDALDLIGRAKLIECICAEFVLDGELFVAYDGDFYRVARSFVQRIDNQLASLPQSDIRFPAYGGDTEPQYIDMVKNELADQFVVLDRVLIRAEGETGVEASDLVAESGALVHVKRKGKSSVLSHLFLQAANSCELLRRSLQAREILEALVRNRSSSSKLTESILKAHSARLVGGGLEVVFAFLGDWRGRQLTSLPLFSRISLAQESQKIANLGYQPSVALVPLATRRAPYPASSR